MALKDRLWKGLYQSIRDVYFKERSQERVTEIEEIMNDVEYLFMELQRLERRTCHPSLVSTQLRNLLVQLEYWEMHQKGEFTDNAIIDKLANRFFIDPLSMRMIIMDKRIKDTWFWTESEGNNELDHFIPFKDSLKKPNTFLKDKKCLALQTRKQLVEYINLLCARYDRLLETRDRGKHKRVPE
jgi:hypothetical protein